VVMFIQFTVEEGVRTVSSSDNLRRFHEKSVSVACYKQHSTDLQ